jgi:hypothetical protein
MRGMTNEVGIAYDWIANSKVYWLGGGALVVGSAVARQAVFVSFDCLGSAYESNKCDLPLYVVNLISISATVGLIMTGLFIKVIKT